MTTRHVKVETDLRRQLLELEESRDQARNDANKAKENLAALDKIIKDEIACTEEDVLLEEEVKKERRMSRLCMCKARTLQLIERNKETSLKAPPFPASCRGKFAVGGLLASTPWSPA